MILDLTFIFFFKNNFIFPLGIEKKYEQNTKNINGFCFEMTEKQLEIAQNLQGTRK